MISKLLDCRPAILLDEQPTYHYLTSRGLLMSNDRHYAFIPKQTTHSEKLNSLPTTARWIYVLMVAERGGLKVPFEFPYSKFKRITGYAKSTISRGIKDLVKAGFIEYEQGGLEGNPNQYILNDNWLEL